jgi:hypothetical protein
VEDDVQQPIRKRFPLCLGLLALLCGDATASTIIDTGTSDAGVGRFGEGAAVETFGQVFVAPLGDTRLDLISFRVDDRPELTDGDNIEFRAYVMAWSGTGAIGSVLYQSPTQFTSNAASYETFTFGTGGVNLVGGGSYIAFISNSGVGDAGFGAGFVNLGNVPYAAGGYFYLDSGNDFSKVYTPWESGGASDLAFRAEFNTQAVPEAASSRSVLMLGLTFLTAAVWRRIRSI